mmetsp:Transcript_42144/g.91839  ORF Transcript_42144/g.91839 Transcript_42144/m.91839 type:complete len:370 (-) Transcript_42144:27-1136(-)
MRTWLALVVCTRALRGDLDVSGDDGAQDGDVATAAAAKALGLDVEQVAAATAGDAGTDPIPGNYRDGFNRPILVNPDLKGRLTPVVDDVRYEESRLRAATADAVNTVLAEERPKVLAKLKASAALAGEKFAKSESVRNSKEAVARAHKISTGLVTRKAAEVCGAMSNLRGLPVVCIKHANTFFAKVKPVATETWAPDAAKAAEKPAAVAAGRAAFKSVIDVPRLVIPPIAYDAARKVFEERFAYYQQEWQKLSAANMTALANEKNAYWSKAESEVTTEVGKEVKKAVWDAPMVAANKKILKVASASALTFSRKAAADHLAPMFAAAAKKTLTQAVRTANGKYMNVWEAKWKLAPLATQGQPVHPPAQVY